MGPQDNAEQRVGIEKARNSLATIWFSGAGIAFIILTAQSALGKFGDAVQEVWAWFVPTMMPTLALMVGVIGGTALQEAGDRRAVKRFFFRLSKALSIFYVAVVLMTLLIEPFSSVEGVQLFNISNYWLAPLQGLVVAAITVLFTSQEKSRPKGEA